MFIGTIEVTKEELTRAAVELAAKKRGIVRLPEGVQIVERWAGLLSAGVAVDFYDGAEATAVVRSRVVR